MTPKKRLAIDAKWYFDGPPSGKRVVINLLNSIIRNNQTFEIYVFLDKKYKSADFQPKQSHVHPVYLWSGNNLLANLFIIPLYLKKYKIDVILLQNFNSWWGRGKKIVYIHNLLFRTHPEFFTLKERLYFSPLCFLAKRADAICTVSEFEKKNMKQFLEGWKDVKVLHHGVEKVFRSKELFDDDFLFNLKTKLALPDRYLLFVGRLNIVKNIDNLLRAVRLLTEKDVHLVFVGARDWKESPDVQQLEKQEEIKKRVRFLGYLNGEELAAVYSLSTIFCFPSYYESFGLPALEAMASGIPVVVSDRAALPEVCGDAGVYINPDSPGDIAEKIDLLLKCDKIYNEKVEAGLGQAKKFNWDSSGIKLLKLVELLVK